MEVGFCMDRYHLSSEQVEMEDFIQLAPCWSCYKYDHNIKDCPEKATKKCSESAAIGHTFCDCNKRNKPKCLNCGDAYRTLATSYPIRRQKMKGIQKQRNNRKQFELESKPTAL